MLAWKELRKPPVQIGNSRGFIIDKKKLKLKSSKTYIIKVIEESDYYLQLTRDLTASKRFESIDKQTRRGKL